jgi:hypothetical protein
MNIFCIVQVRNEARFLPGFLSHIAPYVNGIVALDDCSTDSTLDILRSEPQVVSVLLEREPAPPHTHETKNRHRLIVEAARLGADWVLCADADERFETRFLRRLAAVARINEKRNRPVLLVRIVNLWDSPDQYRTDGICGPRRTARMFRVPTMISRRKSKMHQPWFPPELDGARRANIPALLYHLKMIRRDDREARHAKFTTIDPDDLSQPIGYGHLIDEAGLTLEPVLPFRGYVDSSGDPLSIHSPAPVAAACGTVALAPTARGSNDASRPSIQGFDFDRIFVEMRARRV